MKISDYIRNTIDRFPKGYVFTYVDFTDKVKNKEALIKALNRLTASGRIEKLAKGRYYKPDQSPFGELPPDQYQVAKDLLESDGKLVGYLTGLSIYNKLGLTTQVESVIQIGKQDVRSSFKRGRYSISFVKQKNLITKENIPLLQFLDVLRFIKKIPDSDIKNSCKTLCSLISKLSEKELGALYRLALKYQPSTRALLGAILIDLGKAKLAEKLKKSLNPITFYKLPGVASVCLNMKDWNFK